MDLRGTCEQTDWGGVEVFIIGVGIAFMSRCPQCGFLVFDPTIYEWECPRCQWCPTAGDGGETWL